MNVSEGESESTREEISCDLNSDFVSSPAVERRIVVANQLPLRARRRRQPEVPEAAEDDAGGSCFPWSFDWDTDALVLQMKEGFPPDVEVIYIGCLKAEIEADQQEEIAQFLLDKFRCVPTFLPPDIEQKFYHGFCKHYLWPLLHYMLPISPGNGARFQREQWLAYVSANKIFADKVMEVVNPEEDYVWIHDYHLFVIPSFLRKRFHRLKVGFFLHSPFPSSEIYRTLPVRDDILRALLNCDLIGFHTFDYARHFLSCCSRMLGLDYQSKRGYISLDYYGRTVGIKILPVGIHMGNLEAAISLPQTGAKLEELRRRFDGRTVMVGVDDMDLFKGISLKFMAVGQLLDQNPLYRGELVLVQIVNPARSSGRDVQEVQNDMNSVAKEVNRRYGTPGYDPIVLINRFVPTEEKVLYYALAECCIVNCVRDGMNLVPYKYTVSRQGGFPPPGGRDHAPKKSVIIVSEFIGCSPSLSGAIRVNPWNIGSVTEAMMMAITMPEAEKQLRHEKHYKYISSHDVGYWARSLDQDLHRVCREHEQKMFYGIGLGLPFRVVALSPHFRKLTIDRILSAYKGAASRLILLDYDGTMMPQPSLNKSPSGDVISVLSSLCLDPKNIVFIVSGRGRDSLGRWFSECDRLGLSAEHGYFTRWDKESAWQSCKMATDFEWKNIAAPVMQLYTDTTDGSFIEQKETALVWHHEEADPDFGSCQAKELLYHLENVLANEPVVVKRGQQIVEVKPQGVSKGSVVERLVKEMRRKEGGLEFVLCIGDDRSDEDMFESIETIASNPSEPAIEQVFACTVGQKPSMARYFLDDTVDVITLLRGLAASAYSDHHHPLALDPQPQSLAPLVDPSFCYG